jgi:FkbM family methyltransferase
MNYKLVIITRYLFRKLYELGALVLPKESIMRKLAKKFALFFQRHLSEENSPVSIYTIPQGRVLEECRFEISEFSKADKDLIVKGTEENVARLLKKIVQPGWICFDIGAYHGYYSILFATLGGIVYAYEPYPFSLHFIAKNAILNGKRITLCPVAVMDKQGKVKLQIESISLAANRVLIDHNSSSPLFMEVPCVSIDTEVFENRVPPPNIMKIDIEGAEVLCLKGANKVLINFHPLILLEIHGELSAKGVFDYLSQEGYSLWRIPYLSGSVQKINKVDDMPLTYLDGFVFAFPFIDSKIYERCLADE